MADWIAVLEDEQSFKGWRMPDGFVATGATIEELRSLLGPDLPVLQVGGAPRMVPCAVISPIKDRKIAPIGQAVPMDECGDALVVVAGGVASRPNWDGIVLVAGARSVWMHVSAGEAISFASFISGQIGMSLHATGGSAETFQSTLDDVVSRPEKMAAILARPNLDGAMMWGALIGAELAAAKPYWLGQQVIVTGETGLATNYAKALEQQGVPIELVDVDEMIKAGFAAIGGPS